MQAGEAGGAVTLAMRILVRMAPVYEAERLLPITRAHVDGCIYEGEAGLEFAERLAAMGGRVAVPTSLNVISLDRARWRELGMDAEFASRAARLASAYVAMGAKPTFTCAPYLTDAAPLFGEQIAWSESNAVAYANSVIGARTNRYGDYLDICCALTGRVPASGLHLTENRRATVHLVLHDISLELQHRDDFYPVLGYHLGNICPDGIPAVEGLAVSPTVEQLKSLAAAAASSGAIALFHLVAITPEAPTLEAVTLLGMPLSRQLVTVADLRRTRGLLTTGKAGKVDLVAFGSPHSTVIECRELATLMRGRRAATGVEVFITTSRAVRDIVERIGVLADLEAFGCKVTADTCVVVAPLAQTKPRVMMTNSAKYAHYGPGLLGVESVFGSTVDCVESAVMGRVCIEDGPWAN